jgi:hypothetical protein
MSDGKQISKTILFRNKIFIDLDDESTKHGSSVHVNEVLLQQLLTWVFQSKVVNEL